MRLFLITEDRSKHAVEVVQSIARATLLLVNEDADLRRRELSWAKLEETMWPAASPSAWATRGRQQEALRDLVNRVAEEVVAERPTFVVWHFDGDARWSSGERANEERFRAVIETRVRRVVVQRGYGEGSLERLLTMVPYYSIESWLYRNVRKLRQQGLTEGDRQTVADWMAAGPGALDDVVQVKSEQSVRDRRNLHLAKGWPSVKVKDDSPSYRRTVRLWQANEQLREALGSLVWT